MADEKVTPETGQKAEAPAHRTPAEPPKSDPPAAPKQSEPAKAPAEERKENAVSDKKESAAERSYARAIAARDAHEQEQREINERVAEQREAAREEYNNSERGDVAAQHAEAERLMRLPTPELHKELGTPESDPLRGPSS